MPKLFLRVALAFPIAAAGAAAQGGTPPERFPAPAPVFLDGAGLRPPSAEPTAAARLLDSGVLPVQQEPDYSLSGMFHQAHGDFMLKRQRFDPQIEFRGQFIPDAKVDSEPGHFDLARGVFDAELRMPVSPDSYLIAGGVFDARRYQASNMAQFSDETLYQIGVRAGLGWFLDPDILLEGSVVPSIFSDIDGTLHHNDFDYPADLLVTWRTTPDFFFKVGARYNEIYDEANVLPYLGCSWTPSPEWRIDVMLPETAEISWWPDPGVGILAGIEIQGAQYRVRTSAATGSQQDYVNVQEIVPYAGLMWRSSDYFSVFGRAGAVVAGDYKLTDGTAGANKLDGTLEPAFFLELGFGIDW